ncbi:MAG: GNAT family N-acetyltransferase, partial [Clostridia bacterium]|nr:GNAT family N-acetyltransferase [Clostridia bacterium]
FWGEGIASEAVKKVTEFGLNELGLVRIQGLVMAENQASIRVLEKNGYLTEGLLHHYPFGREFHDVVMLAIIK